MVRQVHGEKLRGGVRRGVVGMGRGLGGEDEVGIGELIGGM